MRICTLVLLLLLTLTWTGLEAAAFDAPSSLTFKIRDKESLHHSSIATSLRGGADVDGRPRVTQDALTPANVASYAGAMLLASFTVALVRNIPRSGGLAPKFMQFLPEPFATGAFHFGYLLHCFLVMKLMPKPLRDVIFSPTGVILLGTAFPVYESIRAAVTDSDIDNRIWLQYWIMHGVFNYSTEFIDKLADNYSFIHKHWFAVEFYSILWMLLPFTDGSCVIFEHLTKPYIIPLVKPIYEKTQGWLTTLALTLVNASYLWWFGVIFMALPVFLKRLAVVGTGTIFPILATVVTVANAEADDMRWLTYWSCFSLLYLCMSTIEKFAGSFPGLYTLCLAAVLYLMLPIFDGSVSVFRKILVPLFRQREALILKDARTLAKELAKQLPPDRHGAARKAAAAAFLEETMQQKTS